ncbi:MAG: segregation ATPase FtsK/SpoIIIE, family [Solirubrobacteraceae bacterium]|jgi:S-DNA-T family DNA segregation ATPase FtsK/SpoIIIE|nr:segregation ATPase FtsK/SpoIIIE, family [Solirubrobacteraceae bacterium]
MPPARTSASRRAKPKPRAKSRAKARAHRSPVPWPPRLPILEQRHLDLIGLGLVAAGVFLAFPLYMGWDGGEAGGAIVRALTWAVGRVAWTTPVALVASGALLAMRPVLPAGVRPFRAGALCLLTAACLGLAMGTLGLGPDRSAPVAERGGHLGELMAIAATRLFSDVGAHILALFLFVAALLLLTGATVAGVLRATGEQVAETTRALRPQPRRPLELDDEAVPVLPPEPEDEELVVRPVTKARNLDGALRYPDLFEAAVAPPALLDEEEELEPVAEAQDDPVLLDPPPPRERAPEPEPEDDEPAIERLDPGDVEYQLPEPRILKRSTPEQVKPDTAGQEKTATRLVEALGHLGVQAQVMGAVAGPHITRYELQLAPGVKMAKVANLKNDLAYALAATEIRILAPIPGKRAVGVEVPNRHRRVVTLGDVYGEPPKDFSPLTVWLGKDVSGKAIPADLAKMPHLLVAGTTGAGKSGAVNAMLSSILLRATPDEVRLVLVDPKQVELNHYEAIPHLLTPVITSPRMAANALQNLVREMEWRYGVMSVKRTRSLPELNKLRVREGDKPLPYILCVIDELADLMMVAPADVEDSIIRLAQKARAVGIHLVLATQSPRVDVITGMIKANVPSRIAFAVSSQTDSRVILDQNGAESLLGMGDMLFSAVGSSRLHRIQGAYIDEPQIAALTSFWARQGEPELREDLLQEVEPEAVEKAEEEGFDPDEDPLLGDAIALVVEMGTASTSMLQRRLRLGYTRAGRLIDMLERRGIISGYEGSKPRQVLVTEGDLPRVLAALDASRTSDEDREVVTLPLDDPGE